MVILVIASTVPGLMDMMVSITVSRLRLRGSSNMTLYGSAVIPTLSPSLAVSRAAYSFPRVSLTLVPKHWLTITNRSPNSTVTVLSVGMRNPASCSAK
jgi:hypothetical protein